MIYEWYLLLRNFKIKQDRSYTI